MWQVLTWTAPSLLFLFLNRAVALAPHLLMLKRLDDFGDEQPMNSEQTANQGLNDLLDGLKNEGVGRP